ncbi:hypothetical protein HMPREF9554_01739 [Treponema phagedenis F0421]|nr:hypothetical protein HMPREF9554_01739 [Treponema phagedenis F0421]
MSVTQAALPWALPEKSTYKPPRHSGLRLRCGYFASEHYRRKMSSELIVETMSPLPPSR